MEKEELHALLAEVRDLFSRIQSICVVIHPFFLHKILSEKYPDEKWQIQGGQPLYDYIFSDDMAIDDYPEQILLEQAGFQKYDDVWCGHLWLKSEDIIIDITADQFQQDAIIITDLNDKRYKCNMDDAKLENAMVHKVDIVDEWLQD